MDQVLRVLAPDERDHARIHAPRKAAEHTSAAGWPVGPHQARTHDEGARRRSLMLDLELRAPVQRAASFERADGGYDGDPRDASRRGGLQQLAGTLDVDPVDVRAPGGFEVVGAMDQSRDVPAPKNFRLDLIAQAKRHRVTGWPGLRKPRHGPSGALEATRQHRAHKAPRAGDRDLRHQAIAAVPIRCALAMTLSVMVVAGSDGKTLASRPWTRGEPGSARSPSR